MFLLIFHQNNLMNFAKAIPFILFTLCSLSCLLTQMQPYLEDDYEQCQHVEQLLVNDIQKEEQMQGIHIQSDLKDKQFYVEGKDKAQSFLQHGSHLTNSVPEMFPRQNKSKICSKRLLQTTVITNSKFIAGCAIIFQTILLMSRNLIFVGIITNTIDIFLPLVIICEAFLMVGFWACQKHYLGVLYGNVFGSYWDLFNAIRLIIQPSSNGSNLPQLAQYGFSPFVLFNLSGEFFVALVLLIFTILSRVSAVCLKYEWLRKMASSLRPVWNGFFFAILPRVATFTGFHWRSLSSGTGFDVPNGILCGIFSTLIIFYFVALLVQTRRVNSKVQRLQDEAEGLGLVQRIDIKRDFQFDCLRYSALYFPCMNYFRMLLYTLPIGLFWDYYYLSYGCPIIAQLVILMAQVSSSSYLLCRDRILYPLQNFLILIVHLCIIAVGLAQSVQHSQVSEVAETLLFSILTFVIGSSMLGVGIDAWRQVKQRCKKAEEEEAKEPRDDGESAQHFTRQLGRSGTMSQAKRQNDSDIEEESSNQDQIIEATSVSFKHSQKLTKLRIKKVRKGKVI